MTSESLVTSVPADSAAAGAAVSSAADLRVLTATLASALTPGDVLEIVTARCAPLLGAHSIHLMLLDGAGQTLRLVASRHSPLWLQRKFATFPLDSPLPTRDAVSTGLPVLIPTGRHRDERYPALKGVVNDQPAWAVVPLVDSDRVIGIVGIGWAAEQAFSAEQVARITEVADLCAPAVARALSYEHEQQARAAAEQDAWRLRELQELTVKLARATDPATVAELVCGAAVRALEADAATIGLFDGDTTVTVLATSGLPSERVARWSTFDINDYTLARDALHTGKPVVLTSFADRDARYPELTRNASTLQSWVTLPLLAHEAAVGLVSFGWIPPRTFGPEDLEYMTAIASPATFALDRSQLLAASQQVAATMQRALLPKIIKRLEGWHLAACYLPAVEGTQVGGDWYDAFALPGGRVGLVLGDVAGKGIHAATVMGSVRSAARAFAITHPEPATVLTRLDHYFAAFKPGEFVTCWYAVLDPAAGVLSYASAGQLPPLVIGPAGGHCWLDAATTAPLGAGRGTPRRQTQIGIAPGDVLLMYSDGLIERRDRNLPQCMRDLARAAACLPAAPDLQAAATALVHEMDHPRRNVDDIAILALRRTA